jgi:molecular chaperone DnaJ
MGGGEGFGGFAEAFGDIFGDIFGGGGGGRGGRGGRRSTAAPTSATTMEITLEEAQGRQGPRSAFRAGTAATPARQRRQARHQRQDLHHLQRHGQVHAPGLLQHAADLPALPRHGQDHPRALHILRRPGQGQAPEDAGSEDSGRHRRRHAHPLGRQRRARHQWRPGGRPLYRDRIKDHDIFERDGDDLHCNVP